MASSLTVTSMLLTLGVVFVNGLTDAPNAVSTVVVTRCLSLRKALLLSGALNFAGVWIMSAINNSVTETVFNIVSFGEDYFKGSVALSAALFSIVLWAVIAWYFGIPTSESHALLAGLTGSALAINNGLSGVNGEEWLKALKGLFSSCAFGLVAGFLICRFFITAFRNSKRSKADAFFKWGQIFAAVAMSFMHGAQDGQKFIAVLMLTVKLSGAETERIMLSESAIIFICSLFMASGTMVGGKKIIKSVGMDMVKPERFQGFSADVAASVSLLLSTLWGFPVSTTHAKTTAMLGAGLARDKKTVNPAVIKDIALTWALTFPGCIVLGYVITRIFLRIF